MGRRNTRLRGAAHAAGDKLWYVRMKCCEAHPYYCLSRSPRSVKVEPLVDGRFDRSDAVV